MGFGRSVAACALVLVVLAPGLGPIAAEASEGEAACAGHLCQCARRCPPKRTTGSSCHGGTKGRVSCEMRGACHHDGAVAATGSLAWTAPEASVVDVILAVRSFRSTLPRTVAVGFSRIDPRPPRRA